MSWNEFVEFWKLVFVSVAAITVGVLGCGGAVVVSCACIGLAWRVFKWGAGL